MKVAGFSFVRNAIKFDYPIVEAITSVLPLCDEFVVVVGDSDDDTLALVNSIPSDKIRIVRSVWDDNLREECSVLAVETDKGLAAISPDVDWVFYIQGDEVLHEKYIPVVREAMQTYLGDRLRVEGLLFHYRHFYGSYNYVGDSRKWYRREVRVIRNTGELVSYKDAQGFRKKDGTKPTVKLIDACIYHYGWVKPVETMRSKIGYLHRFWSSDEQKLEDVQKEAQIFSYENHADSLALFTETHPAVMQERIARSNWPFVFDTRKKSKSLKVRVLDSIERLTGWRIGEYRNYKLLP
ncbi:MAG: glycosyltransferase family 2 protein [Rudanella sp.]|nr:glycosyltransferase family 2 protein [Rudanella sp.]